MRPTIADSRRYAQKKQEARLYLACVAAILLPIGTFVVAWTSTPSIPWIVPVMGLTVSNVPRPDLSFSNGNPCIHVHSGFHDRDCCDSPSWVSLSCRLVRTVISRSFPEQLMQYEQLQLQYIRIFGSCWSKSIPYVLCFFLVQTPDAHSRSCNFQEIYSPSSFPCSLPECSHLLVTNGASRCSESWLF